MLTTEQLAQKEKLNAALERYISGVALIVRKTHTPEQQEQLTALLNIQPHVEMANADELPGWITWWRNMTHNTPWEHAIA